MENNRSIKAGIIEYDHPEENRKRFGHPSLIWFNGSVRWLTREKSIKPYYIMQPNVYLFFDKPEEINEY